MKKIFISNIFLVLGLNFLVKPLYIIGIETQVQNIVGPSTFGIFFALFNFCFLFQFFLDLGIQNYSSKHISEDRNRFIDHFGHLIIIKLGLSLLFVFLVLFGLYIFDDLPLHLNIVLLIIVQMILLSFVVFLRANLSALGHYTWDSILSSLDKFLLIAILGYIIWISDFSASLTIKWFVLAQIFSLFVTLVAAITILVYNNHSSRFAFSVKYAKNLLTKSFPYALVLLLMTLYTRMDAVMLKHLVNDEGYQAGLYAAGYRIMDALNMVGYLFATLLLPMFAHLTSAKERNELFDTSFRLLFTLVGILTLGGFFYAQPIMDILYLDSNINYGIVFSILMCCFFSISIAYIFGSMVTASGKMKELNYIYASGIFINWGLNLYLIPKYLAQGAAMATLVTQVVVLVGLIIIAKRNLNLHISSSLIWKTLLFIISCILVFLIIHHFEWFPWYYSCILSSMIALLISVLLGFLRLDIIQLIKYK